MTGQWRGLRQTRRLIVGTARWCWVLWLRRNSGLGQIRRMIEEMTYISEHLTSLRQEITELRDLNTRYSAMSEHGPLDQSALEVRANRLLQIKQELSGMLERPNDPKVWWDRVRKPAPTR